MKKWLLDHVGWLGGVALVGAIFFYVISYNGLYIGIGEVTHQVMATAWAIGVQLIELLGVCLNLAGLLEMKDEKTRSFFVLVNIVFWIVLALDFLAVFIGYGDVRNLPAQSFSAIVAVLTRIAISGIAAIGPEALTTAGLFLIWMAWHKAVDVEDKDKVEPSHQPTIHTFPRSPVPAPAVPTRRFYPQRPK